MNKICFGCGVKLQSERKNALGYVPKEKFETSRYCMRCFRMIHYGEAPVTEIPKEKKEIIRKINNDNKFVVFLVDFLNLSQEVVDIFKAIDAKKMLVINKCELMPSSINKDKFLEFVREFYKITSPIKLKGGVKFHGAKSLSNYLINEGIKCAYVLGLSNSGKSTLINDLIKVYDASVDVITVNKHANTTIDFIRVKLNDDLTLIDSPGFILDASLNNDVTGKAITAYSMNMRVGETIGILDNKYFLKFDANSPIVFYTNAMAKNVVKKYFRAAPGLVNTIKIENDNMDIVIKGVGFINVKRTANVTTNIDLKYIEVRESMFGGCHE